MNLSKRQLIALCGIISIWMPGFARERSARMGTSGIIIGNSAPTTVIPGLGRLGTDETFRDFRNLPFRPLHHRVCVNGMLRDHGHWWWFHQATGRWLFWNGRNWCWRDAFDGGIVYYYVGGDYYPAYDYSDMEPQPPSEAAPAKAAPAPPPPVSENETFVGEEQETADAPIFYYSADGARMVQVTGEDHEAKLYDSSIGGSPVFLADLTPGVQNVKISGSLAARSLQISVYLENGGVERFESDGEAVR